MLLDGVVEQEKKKKDVSQFKPKLYKVGIGMGYLELPQVRASSGRLVLTRQLLDTRGVYILDCHTDIFVWIGLKSTRLVRTAALKLSASLDAMINRPEFTVVIALGPFLLHPARFFEPNAFLLLPKGHEHAGGHREPSVQVQVRGLG